MTCLVKGSNADTPRFTLMNAEGSYPDPELWIVKPVISPKPMSQDASGAGGAAIKDLRRFCIRVSSTKVSDIDVSDFTVEDGSNCCCTSTTNRLIVRILSIINDIHRWSIGITLTTCQ